MSQEKEGGIEVASLGVSCLGSLDFQMLPTPAVILNIMLVCELQATIVRTLQLPE